MDKRGRFQAKDIDDVFFLRAVDYACNTTHSIAFGTESGDIPHWSFRWDLERLMPMFPERVILAKASALIRRGLMSGCDCGCRGDFELTKDGKAFLREMVD
jgi:hypothetical protein